MDKSITALIATHRWLIESDYRMCADGFEREYWRGHCSACGSTGRWRFWRSHAEEDRFDHLIDADEKRLDSPE